MPQLKSGRRMALSAKPYLDAVTTGSDAQRCFAIVALRLHAFTPDALVEHLVIAYFVDGTGTPPNARTFDSGWCVGDVLQGRTDWNADDVEELRLLVTDDARFKVWLQAQFDEIDAAIREARVWTSELLQIGALGEEADIAALERAAVLRAARDPDAMSRLRALGHGA